MAPGSEAEEWPAFGGVSAGAPDGTVQPGQRRRQMRVDTGEMDRIAARFDEGAHRGRGLRLAQDDPVDTAPEDLAELPRVVADVHFVRPMHRRLDHDGRSAVARPRRTAIDETPHVLGEAGEIEAAVLHSNVDVIGPDMGVVLALLVGEDMAGVMAGVIDRLIFPQQLRRPVDPVCH